MIILGTGDPSPLPQAPPDTQTVKTLSDRPRAPGS